MGPGVLQDAGACVMVGGAPFWMGGVGLFVRVGPPVIPGALCWEVGCCGCF